MSSMITLGIGRMEIDWGKNLSFRDHSALFQPQDLKLIPYYYVDNTDEPNFDIEEKLKEGLSRKLSSVKMRLDLLGYDLVSIKQLYENLIKDSEAHGCTILFSFDCFFNLLIHIDIQSIDTVTIAGSFHEYGYDLGEYVRRCIFNDPQFKQALPIDDYKQEEI